jgi:hypothetical protein
MFNGSNDDIIPARRSGTGAGSVWFVHRGPAIAD